MAVWSAGRRRREESLKNRTHRESLVLDGIFKRAVAKASIAVGRGLHEGDEADLQGREIRQTRARCTRHVRALRRVGRTREGGLLNFKLFQIQTAASLHPKRESRQHSACRIAGLSAPWVCHMLRHETPERHTAMSWVDVHVLRFVSWRLCIEWEQGLWMGSTCLLCSLFSILLSLLRPLLFSLLSSNPLFYLSFLFSILSFFFSPPPLVQPHLHPSFRGCFRSGTHGPADSTVHLLSWQNLDLRFLLTIQHKIRVLRILSSVNILHVQTRSTCQHTWRSLSHGETRRLFLYASPRKSI